MKGIERFKVSEEFNNPRHKSIFIDSDQLKTTDTIEAIYSLLIDNIVSDLDIKEYTIYDNRPIAQEYHKTDRVHKLRIKFRYDNNTYVIDISTDTYTSDVLYGWYNTSLDLRASISNANEKIHNTLTEYWPKFFHLVNNYDAKVKEIRAHNKLQTVYNFIDICRKRQINQCI